MSEKIILKRPEPITAKEAEPYIRKEKTIIFAHDTAKAKEKTNDCPDDE